MGNINDFGFPFTSVGADRQYAAEEWRDYFAAFISSGINRNIGNGLRVNPQASPNKTVYTDTGAVLLLGAMRIFTSATNHTIADNSSGNPRIDRIVARINFTDRKIEQIVKRGTPAASPVAPSLTRDATAYEISLAKVTAANGFTTITAANITDERADTTVCGYASLTPITSPVPTGMIGLYPYAAPPEGWLVCNGANISRATYADLFAKIGTTFGVGDGSTTFALPNLHDEFIRGTTNPATRAIGNKQAATALNNGGSAPVGIYWENTDGNGTLFSGTGGVSGANGYTYAWTVQSHKVRPQNTAMLPCIKY